MKMLKTIVWIRLLAAFCIAITLWAYVDITTNPSQSTQIDLLVGTDKLPEGIVVIGDDGLPRKELPTVKVNVTASQSTINAIKVDTNIWAYVDCTGVGEGLQSFEVKIGSKPELGFYKAVPLQKTVSLQFDRIISAAVPLERITETDYLVSGAFSPRITVESPIDEKVTYSGPAGKVKTIAKARYDYSISAQTSDGVKSGITFTPYTAGGEVVTGVESTTKTISIKVAMHPASVSKRVVVIPDIQGVVAAGYQITNITVEPTTVQVTTESDVIDAVKEVRTEPINVDGMTDSISQEYALVEPKLGNDVTSKLGVLRAFVRITIEKHTEPIRVKLPVAVKIVDAPDGMVFRTEPSTVYLDVEIPAELQGALNTLEASVSVGAWDPASPSRQIRVVKAKGLQILNKLPFVTLIPVTSAAPELTPTAEQPVVEETPTPTDAALEETVTVVTATPTVVAASPTMTATPPAATATATAIP